MNVKEIERRSALPRSVIRYYESEGLLHPQRLANGYRDYSEADLETLLKIKRLRELGASVAEIRAVQSGEAELADVLGAALGRLGEQRGEVSESMADCRSLMYSGAGWDDMLTVPKAEPRREEQDRGYDPDRSIKYPPRRTKPPRGLDWTEGLCTPGGWRRFFARDLDTWFLSMLAFSLLLLCGVNPSSGGGRIGVWLLSSIAMFIYEPLCLHFFAATPGKALFGISVRTWEGGKLSVRDALQRTWKVYVYGLGLNIPGISFITLILAWRRELRDIEQPWDADYGRWVPVYNGRSNARCAVGAVACAAAAFGVVVLCILNALMPPVRPAVTAEDFSKNFNYLAGFHDLYQDYEMTPDGLKERENDQYVVIITDGDLFGGHDPEFTLTETDGVLTRVEFERTVEGGSLIFTDENYLALAVMSYIWGRPGAGLLNYGARTEMLEYISDHQFKSFSTEWAGVRVTCTVEFSGYDETPGYLFPNEDENTYYSYNFVMEAV